MARVVLNHLEHVQIERLPLLVLSLDLNCNNTKHIPVMFYAIQIKRHDWDMFGISLTAHQPRAHTARELRTSSIIIGRFGSKSFG